jgi:hypothetical protein
MSEQLKRNSELPSRAPLDYVEIAPWDDRIQSDEDLFEGVDKVFFVIAGILILIGVGIWFV